MGLDNRNDFWVNLKKPRKSPADPSQELAEMRKLSDFRGTIENADLYKHEMSLIKKTYGNSHTVA